MTDVSTDHPYGLPYIELNEEGRQLSFRKDCLGTIKISRKVNDGNWEMLIQRTSTPFTDTEAFPEGTRLAYSIELEQNGEKKEYQLEALL